MSGAESRELSNELNRIQKNYIEKVLSRHRLRNNIIPGIGPALSKRLSSHGINTAADFVDFVVYYYNNPNGEAFLKLNNGQNIRVYGIGPQKASALQAWRNSLLNRYSGEIPKQLSTSEVNRIKSKYRMKLQSLNDRKKSEENIASEKISNICRKYISMNKLLSSRARKIKTC